MRSVSMVVVTEVWRESSGGGSSADSDTLDHSGRAHHHVQSRGLTDGEGDSCVRIRFEPVVRHSNLIRADRHTR